MNDREKRMAVSDTETEQKSEGKEAKASRFKQIQIRATRRAGKKEERNRWTQVKMHGRVFAADYRGEQ